MLLINREPLYRITEIAQFSGFYDVGYFTRMFKKKTGMTPSEYRANNAELENTLRRLFSEMDTAELKNSNIKISNLVKKIEKLLDITKNDIKAIPYKEINNHVCELFYQVMSLDELQKFEFNKKDEILGE